MDKLTYLFPAAVAVFLLLLFSEYLPVLRGGIPTPPAEGFRWRGRDTALLLGITAVYAFVAFLGLGDTVGIQSFHEFSHTGDAAQLELREPVTLGKVRYYPGLYMGDYTLQVSADGQEFTDAATLQQGHADVFKWKDADLSGYDGAPVRFVRVVAGRQLWLGELALYDEGGHLLDAATLEVPDEYGALFDEQTLIPEKYDYRNSTYFDEIYHARTAYEHIQNIYPYEISHPPLGKLLLGLGIRLFGMTPFGWRFSGTLIGVLMLPALYLFLKKLTGGTAVPACGTAVFAFDFMHYVQTRIATIDSYAVFFIILMYLFFWLYLRADKCRTRSWLPPLALSGLCFGLGAASKWICIYAGGGLAVLWLLERVFRIRALVREGRGGAAVRESADRVLWSLVFFVVVPALVYLLSYLPYGAARGMSVSEMLFPKQGHDFLDLVVDNQKYMFNYHSGVDATHPYSSVWWQWILDIRPILYYLEYPADGTHVSFAAWVNPVLCWGGLLAMLCMVWQAVRWRDKTALFILVGYLAQLLPWTLVTRVVFEYHYFPSTVFLLLAVCHVFRSMQLRLSDWKTAVFSFTGVAVGLFFLFYPALRGLEISSWFGNSFLKWLPSWPL